MNDLINFVNTFTTYQNQQRLILQDQITHISTDYCLICNEVQKQETFSLQQDSSLLQIKDIYTNPVKSPYLIAIEESISSIYLMDIENIAKIIAEYGVSTCEIEPNTNHIIKLEHYTGETYIYYSLNNGEKIKDQYIIDNNGKKRIMKEWYISGLCCSLTKYDEEENIIEQIVWSSQDELKKIFAKKIIYLNLPKPINVEVKWSYRNNKKYMYFEDDTYIHDAEINEVTNKCIEVSHVNKEELEKTIQIAFQEDQTIQEDLNAHSWIINWKNKFRYIGLGICSLLVTYQNNFSIHQQPTLKKLSENLPVYYTIGLCILNSYEFTKCLLKKYKYN